MQLANWTIELPVFSPTSCRAVLGFGPSCWEVFSSRRGGFLLSSWRLFLSPPVGTCHQLYSASPSSLLLFHLNPPPLPCATIRQTPISIFHLLIAAGSLSDRTRACRRHYRQINGHLDSANPHRVTLPPWTKLSNERYSPSTTSHLPAPIIGDTTSTLANTIDQSERNKVYNILSHEVKWEREKQESIEW